MLSLFKKYFRPFWALFIAAFVLTSLRVLCELKLPDLMSSIIDDGVLTGNLELIMNIGLSMLLWAAGSLIFDCGASLMASRASMGFGRDLRSAIYTRVCKFSLSELDEFGISTLITRTTNDVQQLERFVQMSMTMAMMSPIMLVCAAVMVIIKSAELSVVLFAACPLLIVMVVVVLIISMGLLRSLQQRIDALNLVTREGLSGVRVIRAYCQEQHEQSRFARANLALAQTNMAVARRMGSLMPLSSLALNAVTVLVVWLGAGLVNNLQLQIGDLMAVIQYAFHVLFSAMITSSIFMLIPRAAAAAERIAAVLELEPSICDAPQTASLPIPMPALADTLPDAHTLRFEHVSYSFGDAQLSALDNINVIFEAGKNYVLLGPTGSGKTTLVNLIERFYEPKEGRIFIDEHEISSLSLSTLRSMISYVPQKATLFSGSLSQNIAYGVEQASQKDIEAASRAACAYEFIASLPDGFETYITQAAPGLSGGQVQRVAIARALLKRAGLYIFDDPFSALDFKTERDLRSNLKHFCAGATVLIVSQRISVAMDADEVLIFDEGRIVARGSHDVLIKSCGLYQEIVASQMQREKPVES